MLGYYYKSSIQDFHSQSTEEIVGKIVGASEFDTRMFQNKSWAIQIEILKPVLLGLEGTIFFEFTIPRMGKRVDAIIIIEGVVFVVEFKVGEEKYHYYQIEQVWDYALDLKNFHKPSHKLLLAPILVATEADYSELIIHTTSHNDFLILPLRSSPKDLRQAILNVLNKYIERERINAIEFETGSYAPTPTIVEAAISLYNDHSVEDITRNDAEAINLTKTTEAISRIINEAKSNKKKIICFVTGVPGAGKTLVGLKIATTHLDKEKGNRSVYLSGNAPLVAILQEALTRDKVKRESEAGKKVRKAEVRQSIKSFIQIIHHYRDAYLGNPNAPYDHVAIFDEAQRVWNKEQTVKFMRQKKGRTDFDLSEPEFLISCLDRHKDWAVVICLVGGGQEINTGEAGISEWLNAIMNRFPHWETYVSPHLSDSEYDATKTIEELKNKFKVTFEENLHLSVSMRSFRSEKVSLFVKNVLDLNLTEAKDIFASISENYPIKLTRDLNLAKSWLKEKARGSERYGLIVSSQAQRLKPFAIDVKTRIDPVDWFLEGKDDVRSSFFLEDVATEFQIQGLELDWTCITWDGDLRFSDSEWRTFSFRGSKWQNIHHPERKRYLVNAYRVLLTRARQGMIIVVPYGNHDDHTRNPKFYDSTFEYLKKIGIPLI